MNKKTVKAIVMLLIGLLLISFVSTVFAAELDPKTLTPSFSNDDSGITTKAGKIMGMIRNISAIAAVIVLMVLGVKYMLGSVEEKAEYKKSFMPLIIGIILVVCATSIASFIFNMAK